MRPRKPERRGTDDELRSWLDQIIEIRHELVGLAEEFAWDWLDDDIVNRFSEDRRPAIVTGSLSGCGCGNTSTAFRTRRGSDAGWQSVLDPHQGIPR